MHTVHVSNPEGTNFLVFKENRRRPSKLYTEHGGLNEGRIENTPLFLVALLTKALLPIQKTRSLDNAHTDPKVTQWGAGSFSEPSLSPHSKQTLQCLETHMFMSTLKTYILAWMDNSSNLKSLQIALKDWVELQHCQIPFPLHLLILLVEWFSLFSCFFFLFSDTKTLRKQ